jgi:CheY-like chemotaxis protein
MLSVLIVDDDADMRLLTRRLLTMLGCEVFEAKNGTDGEEKALEMKPHMVLLDIMMPGQDGYETAKNLRERQYVGDIVLASALQEASAAEKIANCGANGYLQKPLTREMLRTHIERVRTQLPA